MSKFINRRAIITIGILLIILVITACTSGLQVANKKETNHEQSVNGKEKLRFWVRAATKDSVTGKLVERYNKENKDNVEIEFEVYGENYMNAVTMALAEGNPPDIFELTGGMKIQQLADAGRIIPIDKFMDQNLKNNIYPEVLTQKNLYYQGRLYTIPERISFFRLMYNKDIFKKVGIPGPPETIEQLVDYAEKITKEGKGEFYGYGAAIKTSSTSSRFTDNISSISGLTGEAAFDWSTGKFDFIKQKKALQVLLEMQKKKVLYPGALNLDIEVARVKFAQGKIGMMIDWNWMVGVYGNGEVPCNINWDSAPLPTFSGDKRGKSYMSFEMGKLISSNTKSPEKAWNFINYLLQNQDEFVKQGEALRTSINANRKENIPKNYKGVQNFTDIENSKAYPFRVQDFLTKLEGDDYDKVYKDIIAGEVNLDSGLEDLTRRYNDALKKSQEDGILTEDEIKMKVN